MTPTLFTNGVFHTLNPHQPRAAALLVDQGIIAAAGSGPELHAHAPAGTRVVDLEGSVVIPGLTDAHIHTASLARSRQEVDLRRAESLEEALAGVRAVLPRYREGEWIFGGWWDFNRWKHPVQPDHAGLDAVAPRNPVALTSADGHTVWANSQALRALGIDRMTPDPAGGEIVRDTDGEATGLLRESAVYPVRRLAASGVSGNLTEQLRETQQYLLSLGLTGVHDIDGADALAAYSQLRDEGALALRVHKLLAQDDLQDSIRAGLRTGQGDSWIRHGAVKIFADGAAGSHTCHMSEPFPGGTGHGMEVTAFPELVALATSAATAGIAVAVHAIGDRANHLVLNALSRIQDLTARHNLRHRIEHVQFLQPADVQRLAVLGVVASMQPQHCPSDLPILGMVQGRNLASYAWRSLLGAGATVAFGSDSPVELPNPFHGLHAAMTRTTREGRPDGGWEPQERITLAEALHGYCVGPSYASGEEDSKGRLVPGMLADFVALDTNIFSADPAEVRETKVRMTVTGGVIRYRQEP
ncbi:amidohydrolase [Arthrobacter sp. ISL-72]|uniref:amidohydrolase n=1 Tax=Arthrobacter sp. ISL-72 TaxID=2819114 RepID=UPI001BE6E762|nr:amidohydrolase [Arthrobacter sp. ISL-72]MBT2597902.1 amidohydrolase [Arthrobacter sp. ISL-72]